MVQNFFRGISILGSSRYSFSKFTIRYFIMQQKIYISSSYMIKGQKKIGNIVFSIDYKGLLALKAFDKELDGLSHQSEAEEQKEAEKREDDDDSRSGQIPIESHNKSSYHRSRGDY